MKKIITIILAFSGWYTAASTPQELFAKANEYYQQEQFADAAMLYDSIVNEGYVNAETFYNLANTHFRLGNLGNAILNYEKALKLNPDDEDAMHNLALANNQIVDEFNVVPTPVLKRIFADVSSLFSSGIWSIIGVFFLGIMLVFVAVFLFGNRNSFILTLALVSLILALIIEGFAYGKYQLEQQSFGILTSPNSYVKSAPANTSQDLYILHEGTKVQIQDSFNSWSKIKLPDGKIGWIVSEDISEI